MVFQKTVFQKTVSQKTVFQKNGFPKKRVFKKGFSKTDFSQTDFSQNAFSKLFFPWFWWFFIFQTPDEPPMVFEKMLFGKPFLWNVWKPFSKKSFCQETLEKGLEKAKNMLRKSIQKSISKNQGQKSSQKKLGQKAKPSPTKNRNKFQNNNARASGARPIFGVVVLNFVSIFCRTWLGFLASFF